MSNWIQIIVPVDTQDVLSSAADVTPEDLSDIPTEHPLWFNLDLAQAIFLSDKSALIHFANGEETRTTSPSELAQIARYLEGRKVD